jgi:hypothetical protein
MTEFRRQPLEPDQGPRTLFNLLDGVRAALKA